MSFSLYSSMGGHLFLCQPYIESASLVSLISTSDPIGRLIRIRKKVLVMLE